MHIYPTNLPQQLDFPFVAQWVAELCSNAEAKERALALKPLTERAALEKELQATDEILQALQRSGSFPSAQYDAVRPALGKLKLRGNFLELEEFANLRSACRTYQYLYDHLQKQQSVFPELWLLIEEHEPPEQVVKNINGCLDEHGKLKPNASRELERIGRQLNQSRAAAQRIFARVVKKLRGQGILADFEESISESRRVVAVQAAYKSKTQGIFHGSSAKNSIVFVEPGETVEVNNRIAQLLDEEKQEIRRILLALTAQIQPFAQALNGMVEHLNTLDFWRAKALFAHREEACLPRISQAKEHRLIQAYNPVLKHFNRLNGKNTVPLDINLQGESRIVVISGPNAGGKSITLKTVGLTQYMLQCGLLVCVHPESELRLFYDLLGDIGDAQSIENELSTYSSKLQKMEHFLTHAQDETLILLDEFGSGSDPDLGSALAQIFLEKLSKFGVTGVCTTHFNSIKNLAAHLPGVQNAAMLFNQKTFKPQYRLETGSPGSSYTFEVAAQSNIPRAIIDEARLRVNEDMRRVDELLVKIQSEKNALESQRKKQNKELLKLQQMQNEQQKKIDLLEEKLQKNTALNEEKNRLLYWGERFQKLVNAWMEQKTNKDKRAVVARFIGLLNQRAGEVEKKETKSHSKDVKGHQKQLQKHLEAPVQEGEEVRILESGIKGTLLKIKGDKYQVALGGNMTAVLEREQFVKASVQLGKKPQKKKRAKNFAAKSAKSKSNIQPNEGKADKAKEAPNNTQHSKKPDANKAKGNNAPLK